ncbi:MAG: TatD family hydrolase [Cyclobacteriaceae bacterium]|nr:TatD family hydrolase [Cyclobacteriaceae bacterium HetDA_MAG_MS6]
MLIDSHAHIYLDQFDEDRLEMMDRAQQEKVLKIYMPNIDSTSIDSMLEVYDQFEQFTFPMMGLHPCSVKKDFERELYLVEEWLEKGSFIAVGEIGTDLYWDKTYFAYQQEAFKVQCELALQHELPIVVHCRESIDETIELVQPYIERGLRGVFHCFTGDIDQAKKITDLGMYLGIGGVATFKNGGLHKVLPEVDMHRMVLETDSPYLAPVPHRGKRNEPSYIPIIAQRVADLTNLSLDEVSEITTKNAQELFHPK